MNLIDRIRKIFFASPPPEDDPGQDEEFRIRYQAFRRLLSANNSCLDMMTEMEEAARGQRRFGMHFIRSRVTGITTKVFVMVENLLSLAPGKYMALREALHKIQGLLQQEVDRAHVPHRPEFILELSELTSQDVDDVGGKMSHLGELRNALHMPVPDGFAITAHAYETFMRSGDLREQINCLVLGKSMGGHVLGSVTEGQERTEEEQEAGHPLALLELCAKVRSLILESPMPPEVEAAILDAYDCLAAREGRPVHVALRSSALGEDSAQASFAGQHRSLLNVDRDGLLLAYKEVIASKYSAHAMTYRYVRGIRDEDVLMCVGCLSMVTSRMGGVVYTHNPLDSYDDRVHITSAWGVAKGVVDGTATCDQFVVSKADPPRIEESTVPRKESCLVCSENEGVCRLSVDPELCEQPTLDEAQIQELVAASLRIEQHYGGPQDIEWAFTPDLQLMLLQTRPLDVQGGQGPRKLLEDCTPLLHCGNTASPGAASGVVHIVRKDVDMLLLPENAVLVCVEASPKWAAVLARCQGIIAEQGSVAGHLANVAREFGVPALFGATDATKILAPGQVVTLDADNAAVYPGQQDALLDQAPRKPVMAEDSPVFQTLLRVSAHIAPLNLTNPDSVEFAAANCQTLHDITRFCHEKSVAEMFSFGRDHNFSLRSSKQLKSIVPMQWWVINLEDGFHKETHEDMVSLANIASIPMLALWRGIEAFPWEGPPSLDGKGFLAVLFQATANRNLEPTLASNFAERNYFMISKHFRNLQSRFGFHFTSVEALAGSRARENYIRFRFKGGAADAYRRERRASFVGEILEEYDFHVKVREDAMFARIDGCDQSFVEKRLELLGHILMHTRQLDMIMSREDVVQFYKERIMAQLNTIMKNPVP
ncbi:MAG: pyruvate, water dikinase [Desulfovibrionales bacterium]|nr:pyruvate, water dikinase [Desulfovibrionales bacterium]